MRIKDIISNMHENSVLPPQYCAADRKSIIMILLHYGGEVLMSTIQYSLYTYCAYNGIMSIHGITYFIDII